ncbi:MAG: GTP 3',8-cyclase MoaA [Chloroflexi bacterium]|nr:GTP 3',8-cyclase MoaA [Chloroflexota bacterium]
MTGLSDSFQRPIDYLRISVTDRCNLRCIYCMPEEGIDLFPREDMLSYEEIYTVARAAAELGISKVRLTGGEPLVRAGLSRLVSMLAGIEGIEDIALTTNGVLLARYAAELKAAGLRRVNVSLDTLRPDRFQRITRGQRLEQVLEGLRVAEELGLTPVKINVVAMRGINDDEIPDFARKTIDDGWNVRFIELMPFGEEGAKEENHIPVAEIRERLEALGPLEACMPAAGGGPARYFRYPNAKGSIGFISPISEHFCTNCNRLRLTADGHLHLCLLGEAEVDLRAALRSGVSQAEIKAILQRAVAAKPERHYLAEGKGPFGKAMAHIGG